MKPEEQRIAIAEAVGWTGIYYNQGVWMGTRPKEDRDSYYLPDYLHDLNAMHEAENTLTKKQKKEYEENLSGLKYCGFMLCFATSSQRAEAFLKTLNLWKND